MTAPAPPEPAPPGARPEDRLAPLVALLAAGGLALQAVTPAWLDPSAWVLGNWTHPDNLSNHWLLVWVAERLSAGESILHNSAYYWPVGDDPVRAGNGTEGVLYLPFHHLFGGWPGAVVPYVIAVLTLNGLGGYALGRAAGAGPWGSLVPLAATGLCPYVLLQLSSGRFSQVSIGWLLLFLASWLSLLRRPRVWRGLLAALLLAITSFFYWFHGLFGVIAGAFLFAARPRGLFEHPRPFAAFAAVFLLLIAPWAAVFLGGWEQVVGTAELGAFPHPQAVQDGQIPVFPPLAGGGPHVAQAQTWTVVILGCLGLVRALVRARREPAVAALVLVLLVFAGLMVGPTGDFSPFSLLYSQSEALRRFWWPSRHVVLVLAVTGVLGGLIAGRLDRMVRFLGPALGLAVVVLQPVLLEAQGVPARTKQSPVVLPPEGYTELAERDGRVLLELPLAPQLAGTQQHLVYQLWHGKTLLTGHALWVDRVRPDRWDAFVRANSFLSQLQRLERGELDGTFAFEGADLQALIDQDLAWISLNREYFALELRDLVKAYPGLLRALFGAEEVRHVHLKVWDLRSWTGRTEVEIPELSWPEGLQMANGEQPLNGRRPESPVFPVQAPTSGR